MKYKPQRSEIKTRELPPQVTNTPKGILIQCPFCKPTHVILPGAPGPCGTMLRVTAVQTYLTSHATRQSKIRCLKCGEIGGEMVKHQNGFVHLTDCNPGTKLLAEPPKFSKVAKILYKLPDKLRAFLEKHMGAVKELQEIDAEGKHTGKILGYFFWKG